LDSTRLLTGAMIIAFGVVLLLARTAHPDWLDRTGWWPLFAIAFGIMRIGISGGRRLSSGVMFVLIGIWGLFNELGVLHYETSWPLVFVAMGLSLVLGAFSIGQPVAAATAEEARAQRTRNGDMRFVWAIVFFAMIFGSLHTIPIGSRPRDVVDSSGMLRRSAVMSQSRTTSFADPFEGAHMSAVMGECDLDLTHASIRDGDAPVVQVAVMMGQAILRVPSDWTVENQVTPVMGDVTDSRTHQWTEPGASDQPGSPRRIVVRGAVIMGQLTIRN
jgi:predicted membrane protein